MLERTQNVAEAVTQREDRPELRRKIVFLDLFEQPVNSRDCANECSRSIGQT